MIKTRLFADAKALGSGVLGGLILSSVRSLLLLRLLGPELMGPWRSAMLVHSFGEFARLGAIRGVGLRIPVLDGKGETGEAERTAVAGGAFAWLVGITLGLFTLAISFFVTEPNTRLALRFIAVVITTAQPGYFLAELAAARHKFKLRAAESVIENSVNLIGVLLLASLFGLWGAGFASISASVLGLLILWRGLRFRFRPAFDWLRTKLLIRDGLPFALTEGGFELLRRMDILVMTFLMGPVMVGYYGISLLLMDFSLNFARNAVTQVLSPHLLREFGRTGSYAEVAVYYEAPARLFSYVLPPLLGVGALCMPVLVPLVLPEYAKGIPAAQITVWSIFFVAIHSSMSSFFVAAAMIPKVLKLFFGIAPLALAGQWIGMSWGLGLEGAAWTAFLTLGLAAAGEVCLAQLCCGRSYWEVTLHLLSLIAPLAGAMGAFRLVEAFAHFEYWRPWLATPLRIVMFLAIYLPVLLVCEYRFSMLRMVREAH